MDDNVECCQRMPLINDDAPSFRANTTQGEIHFPADYKGKWVILFSHPADFTPVCTTGTGGSRSSHGSCPWGR